MFEDKYYGQIFHQPNGGNGGNGNGQECPEGCCTGDEILCVSIPCPIDTVLLGLELQLELPCIRLSSPGDLTEAEVQQLIGILTGILGSLGNLGGSTAS